ncbi:hypothetical protein BZG77_03785 [Salinivibrio sp. IB643]|nr:hypothetical protein BZG77_03785 [Salinivibrio sp. IB643]
MIPPTFNDPNLDLDFIIRDHTHIKATSSVMSWILAYRVTGQVLSGDNCITPSRHSRFIYAGFLIQKTIF